MQQTFTAAEGCVGRPAAWLGCAADVAATGGAEPEETFSSSFVPLPHPASPRQQQH